MILNKGIDIIRVHNVRIHAQMLRLRQLTDNPEMA
jgi:dihydropteroate synthase